MFSRVIVAALCSVTLSAGWGAPSARPQAGRGKAIDMIAEGQSLEQSGDTQGAFQKYLQSVQQAPSPAGYYNLGRLSRVAGDRDAATRYLNQALELNPNYEMAKLELTQVQKGSRSKTSAAENAVMAAVPDATGPMNVDKLRREYVTMQSLKKHAELAADSAVIASNSVSGQKDPQPSSPDSSAPAPGYAKKGADPAQPAYIENVSNPKVIIQPDRPGQDVLDPVETVPARGKTLTSTREAANGQAEVLDPLAPTDVAVAQKKSAAPTLPATATTAEVAGLKDEINEAAFGAESKQQPGSKGYGQTTKVALGTFAFHREKGDSYRTAGRYREAAIEYETALRLNPTDVDTRTLYAEMLSRHGSGTAATEQFAEAKAEDPNDARVYYKQGNAYYDQQKFDLATGSYLKAVELDPQNKFAQNNLGVVYMEKGEYAKAVSRFRKVLEIDPSYDMAVLNLGIIYDEHLADKEQARKYYEKYIALKGPRTAEVQRWLDGLNKAQ